MDHRRHHRRIKASHVVYMLNFGGLVAAVSYGGLILTMAKAPWLAGAAFLSFSAGLIAPVVRETLGFADEYAGIEAELYQKHLRPEQDQPRLLGQQEVFTSEKKNVLTGRSFIPVASGLRFAALGVLLLLGDVAVNFF
ncbi:MAG: hypothetical protein A2516_04225 [Alphaproteobacteria bacterium RIFOXYD12_FULL_60_8]|nr:MAG: hypothetical protein A2516_04225 [Alphaproteobacteria bacterium RIFOXYD12_FULL_60_8]